MLGVHKPRGRLEIRVFCGRLVTIIEISTTLIISEIRNNFYKKRYALTLKIGTVIRSYVIYEKVNT